MRRKAINWALICFLMSALLSSCGSLDWTDPTIESRSPSVEYGTPIAVSEVADVSDDHPGAEAVFQQVSDTSGTIGEDGKSVTFSKPGEYTVAISATDAKGNTAQAECPVSVVDTTAPVILSAAGGEQIGYGETLALTDTAGIPNTIAVEYEDISDVSLSIRSIQKTGSERSNDDLVQHADGSVTFSTLGDYILTIDATDIFGNSSSTQADVSVVDRTEPEISGLEAIRIADHDALPSFVDGVTAVDEIDGDITRKMSVDFSAVKKGVPGTYAVRYSVSDAAGNTVSEDRAVLIEDRTAPAIKLSKSSVSLTVGDDEPDYKSLVSASDAADGDVTSRIMIDGSAVDRTKAGTYEVKYSVSDSSGNSSTKSLRVVVRAKTAAPSSGGGSDTGSGGGTVYITRTGSKYHLGGCRYLSRSKIPIAKTDARARGYTACSVCRPG